MNAMLTTIHIDTWDLSKCNLIRAGHRGVIAYYPLSMSTSIAAPMSSPPVAPVWVFGLLCVIFALNAFDRNIVGGAPAQFQFFIQTSLNTTDEGALLGLLSSSFITSFSICIPIFGYLAMTMRPFRLIALGMSIWCVAVCLCSLAKQANSFELLFLGRVLSGVGEASFQCIAPPFIHDHAPTNAKTLWLGIYYTTATVGGTLGSIATSMASAPDSMGWDAVFALEGLTMLPLLAVCMFGIPAAYDIPSGAKTTTDETKYLLQSIWPDTNDDDDRVKRTSFLGELWVVCSDRVFVWLTLAMAAMSFFAAGFGTFSVLLLLGLGMFADETDANVVVGAQGIVAMLLGTLLGGVVLDYTCRGLSHLRQYLAIRQLVVGLPIATLFLVLAIAAIPSRMWFLVWLFFCNTTSGMIAPVITTALFASVEPAQRGLALAMYTVVVHLLGDVPAPVVMGAIKDAWAPHCNSILVGNLVKLNPECAQDKDGLMQALVFPGLWLVGSIGCCAMALVVSTRALRKQCNASEP
ncbi:Aste57867_15239 [Aphanomyces stellatus]|uniref:Aste57867_15239 protein n=1 Tax=Aphanomyces stellatus TaxID=120398 RepID=A0A485L5K0_9STRA|nr:hypothetical protein As57867_015183 [Aphanomyces stellatus]VFT92048.1 Aste57867_15239 [Aphanomyces stellatus]